MPDIYLYPLLVIAAVALVILCTFVGVIGLIFDIRSREDDDEQITRRIETWTK
jgi:hypothetical protein